MVDVRDLDPIDESTPDLPAIQRRLFDATTETTALRTDIRSAVQQRVRGPSADVEAFRQAVQQSIRGRLLPTVGTVEGLQKTIRQAVATQSSALSETAAPLVRKLAETGASESPGNPNEDDRGTFASEPPPVSAQPTSDEPPASLAKLIEEATAAKQITGSEDLSVCEIVSPTTTAVESVADEISARTRVPFQPVIIPSASEVAAVLAESDQLVSGIQCQVDTYNDVTGLLDDDDFESIMNPIFGFFGIKVVKGNIIPSEEQSPGVIAALSNPLGSFARGIGADMAVTMRRLMKTFGCSDPGVVAGLFARAAHNLVKILIGDSLDGVALPLTYWTQRQCPTAFPTAEEATESFLANTINAKDFQAWAEINNQCFEPWKRVTDARRTKLNPNELVFLRRRGVITESQYNEFMRELGYIRPADAGRIFKLSEFVPPIVDLVRFMVRDVEDDKIVKRFEMDTDFTVKWSGLVKKLGGFQGIDDETAKRYWRAHWLIPGPSQLFEMFHRLSRLPEDDKTRIDLDDIELALKQQDIMPFWIPRLLAISQRPLTRVDIRRAFRIGALTRDESIEAYRKIGYTLENATVLVDFAETLKERAIFTSKPVQFWKKEAIDRKEAEKRLTADGFKVALIKDTLDLNESALRNHSALKLFRKHLIDRKEALKRLKESGIRDATAKKWLDEDALKFKSHPAVKRYKAGLISEVEAEKAMQEDGLPKASIDRLLKDASAAIDFKFSAKCIGFVRDRFIEGELTEDQFVAELVKLSIKPQFVTNQLKAAKCERDARGKEASISQLCKWLELGLVANVEFIARLRRVGWSQQDAVRILTTCAGKVSQKRAREAEKEVAGDAKAAAKQEADQARTAKRTEAETKRMEKARLASTKARERREKMLIEAAERLSKADEIPVFEAVTIVKQAQRAIRDELALTLDDSIAAVVLAAENRKRFLQQSFVTLAAEMAVSIQEAADTEEGLEATPSSSSNGETQPEG